MKHLQTPISLSIMTAIVFGILAAVIPIPAYAQTTTIEEKCYMVSGAGMAGVNGIYLQSGTFKGRPAYKHQENGYYIAYEAYFFENEWNLTSSLGGGLDYYAKPSTALKPPLGQWIKGGHGLAPAPTVRKVSCPGAIKTTAFGLEQWASIDGNSGTIGVFTPSSCYEGTLIVKKYSPFYDNKIGFYNIKIHGRYLDINITNPDGRIYETFCGLYYFSFSLTPQTNKLWDAGDLGIYEYDGTNWVKITSYLVDGGDYGRVAFIATHPGRYALGTEQ